MLLRVSQGEGWVLQPFYEQVVTKMQPGSTEFGGLKNNQTLNQNILSLCTSPILIPFLSAASLNMDAKSFVEVVPRSPPITLAEVTSG